MKLIMKSSTVSFFESRPKMLPHLYRVDLLERPADSMVRQLGL